MGSLDIQHLPVDEPVELIFLGTGTSSTLPHLDCLTAPPDAKPCRTCLSTLYPEGKKNIRASRLRSLPISLLIDLGSFAAQHIGRHAHPRQRWGEEVSRALATRCATLQLNFLAEPSWSTLARASKLPLLSGFQNMDCGG